MTGRMDAPRCRKVKGSLKSQRFLVRPLHPKGQHCQLVWEKSVGKRGGQCPAVLSVPFPEEVLPVTTGIDGPRPTLNIDHINFVMLGIFQHGMWGKRQPHLQLVELLSFDSLQLKFRVCILKRHCIWVYGYTKVIKCSFLFWFRRLMGSVMLV